MNISQPAERRRDIKRKTKQPGKRQPFEMYVRPVSHVRLQNLHNSLRGALPLLKDNQLTKDNLDLLEADVDWSDASSVKERYLAANVLSRFEGDDAESRDAREQRALEDIVESELSCRVTNEIFTGPLALDWSNARIPLHLLRKLRRARTILASLIGSFDFEKFPYCVDFTSGATTELPRARAAVHNKWDLGTHCSARARPYAEAFLKWLGSPAEALGPGGKHFHRQEANRVFTVPKNFHKRRAATKPTTWNGALQKGAGTMIRQRLQASEAQLLLPDAQEYHGLLAKIASHDGIGLSTLDVKNASNCVASGLCWTLFSEDWGRILFDLREEVGEYPDGSPVRWEKLATNGNGFTFEVETAVFYSLVKSCCSKDSLVSVYGDDIICPSVHVDSVVELLAFCGFSMNRKKTFTGDHPFRESCGAHYYRGKNIKPFYIQRLPVTVEDVIHLHNDVVAWHEGYVPDDSVWADVIKCCKAAVPLRFWGPVFLDGVLWAEWDECRPRYDPHKQCFQVRSVVRSDDVEDISTSPGALLAKLWEGRAKRDTKQPLPQNESVLWNVLTGGRPWEESLVSKDQYRRPGDRVRDVARCVDRAMWTTIRNLELR